MKHTLIIFSLIAVVAFSSCTNYGKKVSKDHVEVYYKDGMSKDDAQKLLDFLYPLWNKGDKKSVQLVKIKDTITFRMVTDEKKMAQVDDETFSMLGHVFSDSIFNSAPVNVDLTDDHFKTIRTFHFHKD